MNAQGCMTSVHVYAGVHSARTTSAACGAAHSTHALARGSSIHMLGFAAQVLGSTACQVLQKRFCAWSSPHVGTSECMASTGNDMLSFV